MATPVPPVGLLAGAGRFPVLFAEKARQLGIPVVCAGIRDLAPPELADTVHRFEWVGLTRLNSMIRCFKRGGCRQAVMAGKIHKVVMYTPFRWFRYIPDLRTLRFWYGRNRRDNTDDSLMLGVIKEFAKDGIHFASALDFCPELLVQAGVLTRRGPSAREQVDIDFGWDMAREMGRLDVGQSVAVKEKAVLAVEAVEGTDQAILRAGQLCRRGGFVVVKVAKPQQDMRFDVPTVGVGTVETLHKAGASVLAIEAGKTIVVDQADTVALADKYGIAIVAR